MMSKLNKNVSGLSTLTVLLVLVLSQLASSPVYAGRGTWVTDSTVVWSVTQICRNGAKVSMLDYRSFDRSSFDPSAAALSVSLDIRVYPEYDGSLVDEADDYFQFFTPTQSFNYSADSFAVEPLSVALSPLNPVRDYYYYKENNIVRWPQNLPVGTPLLFRSNGRTTVFVEDCEIPAIEVEETYALTDSDMGNGYAFLPLEALTYRLLDEPSVGELKAGAETLSADSTFSAADVAAGAVQYVFNDDATGEDQIRFVGQATFRVSVDDDGNQADDGLPSSVLSRGQSSDPAISTAGSDISFSSSAINLSGSLADNNGTSDVFVRTFSSESASTQLVSANFENTESGNGQSYQSDITPDGDDVVFVTRAGNLRADNPASAVYQIYSRWLRAPTPSNQLKSYFYSTSSGQTPITAANSHFPSIASSLNVAFHTFAPVSVADDNNNMADIIVNSGNRTNTLSAWGDFNTTGNLGSYLADISDDGEFVAYETDSTNLVFDVLDNNLRTDILLSRSDGGFEPEAYISVNSDGVLATGGDSLHPKISRYGNHIVFDSTATNLISGSESSSGEQHVYVHDRNVKIGETGEGEDIFRSNGCTLLMSKNFLGFPGNGPSSNPSVSGNGRYVAFQSTANSLIIGDTNGVSDIFVVDRDLDGDYSFYSDPENCIPGPSKIFRVSISSAGLQSNGGSVEAAISGNGAFVAFTSSATNLVDGDTNGMDDVFLHFIGYSGEVKVAKKIVTTPPICCYIYMPLISKE